MPPKFSLKEMKKIYQSKNNLNSNKLSSINIENELINGKTIKERIEKLSYFKGLR